MKKICLLLLILFITNFKCFTCLNGESKELKNGDFLYMDYDYGLPFGYNFFEGNFEEMKFRLDSIYKKTNDIAYLSDKGLIFILQKKYKEALDLYLQIEKTNPNRYSTASNVGTIYELIGENKKALEWINKSILINPESHNHSEWLHSKILEAKIKGEKFYTSDFILGINFGDNGKPNSNISKSEIDRIYKSIHFQLNERISLIKPKDQIVAMLLFELGNLSILKNKMKDANELFRKAKEYGLESELLEKRLEYAKEQINIKKSKSTKINYTKTILLAIGIILAFFVVFLVLKRRNNK